MEEIKRRREAGETGLTLTYDKIRKNKVRQNKTQNGEQQNNISTFPNIPISPLLDNNNDPDINFYNNLNINFFDFQPGQIR